MYLSRRLTCTFSCVRGGGAWPSSSFSLSIVRCVLLRFLVCSRASSTRTFCFLSGGPCIPAEGRRAMGIKGKKSIRVQIFLCYIFSSFHWKSITLKKMTRSGPRTTEELTLAVIPHLPQITSVLFMTALLKWPRCPVQGIYRSAIYIPWG